MGLGLAPIGHLAELWIDQVDEYRGVGVSQVPDRGEQGDRAGFGVLA